MKKINLLIFLVMLSLLFAIANADQEYTTQLQSQKSKSFASEVVEDISGQVSVNLLNGFRPDRILDPGLIYDNGPITNSPGTGVGGADESVLQTSLGMNNYGFGNQVYNNNRLADDFIVTDPNGWTVDSLVLYGYQTGSSTTSTITAVNYRIWSGVPNDPGSSIVFGDTLTNKLIYTRWVNIYRVTEAESGTSVNRPIMANTVSAGFTLPPGVYWIDWQADGTLASGPWVPPITINGNTTTGNAVQSTTPGVWVPLRDSGTSTDQGLPFLIYGEMNSGPQPAPELMWYKFDEIGGRWTTNYANPATAVNDSAEVLGQLYMGSTGQFGSALIGTGGSSTSDYINTDWATDLSSNWSISMWLNNFPPGDMYAAYYLWGDETAGSFRCFYAGLADSNNIMLRGNPTNLTDVLVTGVRPGPSVVDFVYDSSVPEIRAYVNGVLNNRVTQPSPLNISGTDPFKIGGYSTNVGMPAGALMDEFKLYNRAIDLPPALPTIVVDPTSIQRQVYPGDSTDVLITISNQGEADLIWSASVSSTLALLAPTLKSGQPDYIEKYPQETTPVSLGHSPQPTHVAEAPVNRPHGDIILDNGLAYGCDVTGNRFLKFYLSTPSDTIRISTVVEDLYAGDFGEGDIFYAVDNTSSALVTVDTASGVLATVGSMLKESGHTWTGLTYDVTTSTMYASSSNISISTLYTVNTNTGETTVVGSTTTAPAIVEISVNNDGDMYAHDIVNDAIYIIDKSTAAATLVGPTGFNANLAQGMDFDPNTGILYLAAYNASTGSAELRTADLSTGETILIGPIGAGTGVLVTAFGIPGGGESFIRLLPPTSGAISPGGQSYLIARLYGIDGPTLTGYINFTSNDLLNPLVSIPVTLEVTTDIKDADQFPTTYAVAQNYPNPFNPSTTIKFQLPKSTQVKLTVYNLLGKKMRTLVNDKMGPGHYQVVWNGQNDSGKSVGSGVYIYKFETEEYTQVRKMMFIK
jgi:hypothetical protein